MATAWGWLALVLAASCVARAEEAPDQKKVQEALNKTDVGFFLLLDKNDPKPDPKKVQEALNKTDVGFFLLLDKNDPKPDPKKVQEAVNKTDVGFFLLLDKNEKKPEPEKVQQALNKTDVGFFLLLDKNEKKDAKVREALNKTDVGFFLLLDKAGAAPPDEVALGRQLFFDPRLSSNKTMSCATCHNPSLAWRDGLPRARGLNGVELARRTPTLLNVHHTQQRFLWDGRANSVEEAALNALTSRLEMNRDSWELVRELNRVPDYARQFTGVYGLTGITPENIAKAVASFVKAEIRPLPTAFDRFREDPSALSASAQRGLLAFTGKGRCVLCHTGPGLSNGFFHNTGVKPTPGVEDVGRYAVVANKNDWRAFKTVPLRNVALTAPYMHNGSIKTLREVVEFYDRGGDSAEGRDSMMQPLNLDAREKADLVAFLESLTSPQPAVAVPALPTEIEAPSVRAAALWNAQRARMIEGDLKTRSRKALAANAAAVRENVEAAGRYPGSDLALASDCLSETGQRAALAERGASIESASWTELEKDGRALAASADRCRSLFDAPAAERAERSLAALDRLLGGASIAVAELARASDPAEASRAAGACRASFSVGGFLKEVSAGKRTEAEMRVLQPLLVEDMLLYHQYRAFAAKDPKVCDAMAPVEKHYTGIARTAAWGCREWFWDMSAADALTRRTGKFEEICRHSVAHDYPGMTGQDGVEICGVIAGGINEPEKMCRGLVPKFLGAETMGACVNEFSRYSRDADVGRTQEGVPDQLFRRYVALDRYVRAYRGKDPKACGGAELCRVLMGEGDEIAKVYEAKMRESLCGATVKTAESADPSSARVLLERGGDLLADLEGARGSGDRAAAAKLDERAEKLARLRAAFDGALRSARGDDKLRQGSLGGGAASTLAGY